MRIVRGDMRLTSRQRQRLEAVSRSLEGRGDADEPIMATRFAGAALFAALTTPRGRRVRGWMRIVASRLVWAQVVVVRWIVTEGGELTSRPGAPQPYVFHDYTWAWKVSNANTSLPLFAMSLICLHDAAGRNAMLVVQYAWARDETHAQTSNNHTYSPMYDAILVRTQCSIIQLSQALGVHCIAISGYKRTVPLPNLISTLTTSAHHIYTHLTTHLHLQLWEAYAHSNSSPPSSLQT